MKSPESNPLMAMKAIVAVVAILTSCAPYRSTPYVSNNLVVNPQEQKTQFADLTQILRRIPQVRVMGTRQSATVSVTRNIQFATTGSPLFIVNDMEMGSTYSYVYATVNATDVKWVRVMNDAEALSTYGSRGQNGVIIIHTVYSPEE